MALLMQGCRQEKPSANEADAATNQTPAMVETATPVDTNPPPVVAAVTNPPPVVEPPSTGTAAMTPSAAPAGSDYTIASGDTLGAIARKNHVSLAALKEANPGVEPTKLKIGQKLHIPAPAPAATASATSPAPATEASAGGEVYVVKSGDVLYNIARSHGTSVRALRAANSLKSDRIVVGQRLKLPSKSVTPASAPTLPASAENPPVTPVISSGPAPTTTTHM